MSSAACPMEHLVEARHDGRLGARESASLTRHLAACASCRALERTLDDVRARLRADTGDRVTPLEHQRGRLALLRAAAAPPAAYRVPARVRHAALAAACALCVALGGNSLLGARATVPSLPSARRLPAVSFRWPERAETTIQGSAEARFERRTDGPLERVELADGKIALQVRKLAPGERFVVATADAEVEVRGTIFEVEAREGRLTGVSVSEGTVEVRHQGARAIVARGDSWRPAVAAEAAPAPSAAPVPAAHRAGGLSSSAVTASAGVARDDAASRKFAAAVAKLASGNYGEASEQLAAFRKANPRDARAEDAAFLAIVSLQRAGRLTDAKDAARRYLAAYPNGDRRADAEKAAR